MRQVDAYLDKLEMAIYGVEQSIDKFLNNLALKRIYQYEKLALTYAFLGTCVNRSLKPYLEDDDITHALLDDLISSCYTQKMWDGLGATPQPGTENGVALLTSLAHKIAAAYCGIVTLKLKEYLDVNENATDSLFKSIKYRYNAVTHETDLLDSCYLYRDAIEMILARAATV